MKISIVFLFTLIVHSLAAQVIKEPLSVKYGSLGTYSNNFSDIFSASFNQASLADIKTAALGVYGERRFMLDDLNGYAIIVAAPTPSGSFGFEGDYFGSSLFNESQIGLVYARKITDKLNAGVKFNYYRVKVAGYGSASAVNFEAGTILHLSEKLHAGLHVYNPTGSKLRKTGGDKLSSAYNFGLGYEASNNLLISTEIIKYEDREISVNAGLQYNILSTVFIRIGTGTGNNNTYISTGLKLNFGRVDINAAYHPQLGFTPGLLLLFNLKKADEN